MQKQLGGFDRHQDTGLIETESTDTEGLKLIDPRKIKLQYIGDVKRAVIDGGTLGVEQGSQEFSPLIMWKSRDETQKIAIREVEKAAWAHCDQRALDAIQRYLSKLFLSNLLHLYYTSTIGQIDRRSAS